LIGYSGTYAFNGTNLLLLPTEGHWTDPEEYGYDGSGHPIVSSYRSFEMTWELISSPDAKQLIDFVALVSNTGTMAVDLPQWGGVDYLFTTYSGTTLSPLQVGPYFMGYFQSVRLLILRIAV
jgi:hypothetical protein